jgi:hypothetical protein
LTDHDEIKRWAEARHAEPACVQGTGASGGERLEPISWEEWFKAFDENELALIVEDRTAEESRATSQTGEP